MKGMTTSFAEHQHPRAADGRFAAEGHPEAELELGPPTIALSEATGDWGPRFHDMDFRPAYKHTRPSTPPRRSAPSSLPLLMPRWTGSTASRTRATPC